MICLYNGLFHRDTYHNLGLYLFSVMFTIAFMERMTPINGHLAPIISILQSMVVKVSVFASRFWLFDIDYLLH